MDGYPDGSYSTRGIKQPSPDDASFMYIANLYAQRHKTMAASKVGKYPASPLCTCGTREDQICSAALKLSSPCKSAVAH
eukprot:scaffold159100_cov16-Tisochrysis_lutea.AAC.1